MTAEDRIHLVVDPIVDDLELELVDLVYGGGRLKITIDHPEGLDTQRLTKATRMISHELDLQDPVTGTYTLEVSSPGLERPLRTPAHFTRSLGEDVSIKLKPNEEKIRRLKGELTEATDDGITVRQDDELVTIGYDQIAKAKTVFDWGPQANGAKGSQNKNSQNKNSQNKKASNKKAASKSSQNKKASNKKAANKNSQNKKNAAGTATRGENESFQKGSDS